MFVLCTSLSLSPLLTISFSLFPPASFSPLLAMLPLFPSLLIYNPLFFLPFLPLPPSRQCCIVVVKSVGSGSRLRLPILAPSCTEWPGVSYLILPWCHCLVSVKVWLGKQNCWCGRPWGSKDQRGHPSVPLRWQAWPTAGMGLWVGSCEEVHGELLPQKFCTQASGDAAFHQQGQRSSKEQDVEWRRTYWHLCVCHWCI